MRHNHCRGSAIQKCTWFKSLATLLTPCKQWIILSNLKIHVTNHPKENQKLAMQQNNTGPYNVLSLIKCLIFYQGMNHLVKVAGDIGRIHPIVCVPVGVNPVPSYCFCHFETIFRQLST